MFMSNVLVKRFGGTITMGCDPLLRNPRELPENLLFFSHGRAAMIWLIQNLGPFQSAVVCAYTWPEIPRLVGRYGLKVGFFDFGQEDLEELVKSLPGRCLVIVPVFYGFKPWIEYQSLAKKIGDKAVVLLDAAQTAFGFEDYSVPHGGAVMSCPHKATALNDGAVLAVDRLSPELKQKQEKLIPAEEFHMTKKQGRLLLDTGDEEKEQEGLRLIAGLEEPWRSDPPQRMTDQSKKELACLDAQAHARIRIENYQQLRKRLDGYIPAVDLSLGVPFANPVTVNNREEVLQKLYAKRVFATRLWHNAVYEEKRHPAAADYAKRLMALPIDQRYNRNDMDQLADIVIASL